LYDVKREDAVIHHLPKKMYDELLKKDVFVDGILPKLENAFAAISAGVKEVLIGEAADLARNIGRETAGTLITL
jgi:acetylglutamate kinase